MRLSSVYIQSPSWLPNMKAALVILLPLAYGAVLRPKKDFNINSAWIINGKTTDISNYPWQLSLRDSSGHICGASIINSVTAVTAAHCVQTSGLSIWAGVSDNTFCGVGCHARSVTATVNSNYDPNSSIPGQPYDLAVLKWTEEIHPITGSVYYIPLADGGNYDGGWRGKNCVITGWGKTVAGNCAHSCYPNILQEADVDIIKIDNCRSQHGVSTIGNYHICVQGSGLFSDYTGTCDKDGGGPLACKSALGDWTLVGAASWQTPSCDPEFYSVFASVPYMRTWLDQYV